MSHRPFTIALCNYIKADGFICRSPALRHHRFCYFHQHWHDQRMTQGDRLRRRARALRQLAPPTRWPVQVRF